MIFLSLMVLRNAHNTSFSIEGNHELGVTPESIHNGLMCMESLFMVALCTLGIIIFIIIPHFIWDRKSSE
jgi:hypothetical protein